VSTSLFNFQDLKLSTKDIIVILKDTLNTTSRSLPILNPHATRVLSNTLERHSIGSPITNGFRNLVISFSLAKLVDFCTYDSTFTNQKGVKNTSLVDLLLAKVLWIAILSTKSLTHFQSWCLVNELPSPPELPLSIILSQQSRWEDIHPKWYLLIHVPNR
jgi:hypothetical protein